MASAFRPTYTRPIPEGAERCILRGKPAVKFTDKRGKKHTRRLTPDGKKMVCEQSKWWMRYSLPDGTEKREKGYTDKAATEQEAAKRERAAAQLSSGLLRVDPAHARRSLREHFLDYLEDKERTGICRETLASSEYYMNRLLKRCSLPYLHSVTPARITRFLNDARHEYSDRTVNTHLMKLRAFLNWCVKQGRLQDNPLKHIKTIARPQSVYVRRALSEEEARRLLEYVAATEKGAGGPKLRRRRTKRRLAYLVALTTGLRRKELKRLQWGDVRIGEFEQNPRIELRAEATKSRRADVIPLRQDVAEELLRFMPENVGPDAPVFESVPHSQFFLRDLKGAGIPYKDSSGRALGFHSLRQTFATMLAKAGVSPKVAMSLMRHTDVNLTLSIYTDLTLLAPGAQVNSLPSLLPEAEDNGNQRLPGSIAG